MVMAAALGAILGFISAVPVAGPVSAIIFSYGMRGKDSKGRWIAAGAGLVEGAYAFIAFWGFNHFLIDLAFVITLSRFFAAAALAYLGYFFYTSQKMRQPVTSSFPDNARKHGFLIGAGISIVNPTLIATWSAAITTLYSLGLFEFTTLNSLSFSVGISAGIVLWFTLMLKLMSKHRNKLGPVVLDRGLKVMGIGLISLSLWITVKAFT